MEIAPAILQQGLRDPRATSSAFKHAKLSVITFPLFLLPLSVSAQANKDPLELHFPDGQVRSRFVRAFVNRDLTEDQKPQLQLMIPHLITKSNPKEHDPKGAIFLSRDQSWTRQVDTQTVSRRGTMLLFRIDDYPIPFYKAMVRALPVVTWKTANDTTERVAGQVEVYIVNPTGALMWTAIALLTPLALLASLSRYVAERRGGTLAVLCNPDGSLSLWRSQLAAWSIAVGAVVFGFGLVRLEVPDIPESLVALMGLAITTGGLSASRQPKTTDIHSDEIVASGQVGVASRRPRGVVGQLAELITVFDREKGQKDVSLAKSQMVLWTCLMLVLFVTKSVCDGTLWAVPWQMVTLMGMSQAAYVTPKFIGPGASTGSTLGSTQPEKLPTPGPAPAKPLST